LQKQCIHRALLAVFCATVGGLWIESASAKSPPKGTQAKKTPSQEELSKLQTGPNFLLLEGLFYRPSNAKSEAELKKNIEAVKAGNKLGAVSGTMTGATCAESGCTFPLRDVTIRTSDGKQIKSVNQKEFVYKSAPNALLYSIAPGVDMGWGAFVMSGKDVRVLAKNWERNKGKKFVVTILYLRADERGTWNEMQGYTRLVVSEPAHALAAADIERRLTAVHKFMLDTK
jgi:hypothetical protein